MVGHKFKIIFLFASLLLATVLSGCNAKPSWLRQVERSGADVAYVPSSLFDGKDLGGAFEGDEWVPDDPTIATTYKIPDIGAGFIFDLSTYDLSPSLQIELVEFDVPLPYLSNIKVDFGVAYQRAYVYVGKRITSIFEISAGFYAGWNFEEKRPSWGIAGTIIRF